MRKLPRPGVRYKNQHCTAHINGVTRNFPSIGEMRRGQCLARMERLGEIEDLEFQPVFVLVPEAKPKIKYIPDFSYWIKGEKVAEDFKSAATRKDAVFRLKLRLWGWRGPCRLILTQAVKGGYSEEWLDKGRDPI